MSTAHRIHLCLAKMSPNGIEQKYILEAFDTNWVAPLGPNVDAFEKALECYLNSQHKVATLSSCTAAIHIALLLLGVKEGDEVICQSMSFCASSNPVVYCGAKPIFVDSDSDTWNMSPELLETAIKDRIAKTGRRPKAVIVVDLYGMPADFLATQAKEPCLHYEHEMIGYNYRMSNICAGIGRGQMTVLDEHIHHHKHVHELYQELLPNVEVHDNPSGNYDSNFWLTTITFKKEVDVEAICKVLDQHGIEARPLWKPMHLQPVYHEAPAYINGVSERLFKTGMCLPSGPWVTDEDVRYITDCIKNAIVA